MKVTRNRATRTAWVTQPAYIDRLLERFPQHLVGSGEYCATVDAEV
jgi:hypothetical protein